MAAWGTGLYQDDIAEDVRDDYKKYFKEGLNNEEVYNEMLQRYENEINDVQDGPVFWFALADTMWRLGKLTDEVKVKAIQCIDDGKDVECWREQGEKEACKRQVVLAKLKEKLLSPMPPEKKFGKKRVFMNKWSIGDMYILPIQGEYPRFPEMKAKYLLLIKVGDACGFTDHMEPVVYIKYLEEEYYEGIDVNQLKFSHPYDNGTRFVISGIAGKPKPKELTYVGNYGDISKLERPANEDGKMAETNYPCIHYVRQLENVCVSVYLRYILGIDGKIFSGTKHMTEDEYQEHKKLTEQRKKEAEEKKYEERKKKEYYICPWNDGDVFYLSINEEAQEGKMLIEKGYTGIVLMKVGDREDYATTNMWPVMIAECVKKTYNDMEEILYDKVFDSEKQYKKIILLFKKYEKIPNELRFVGREDAMDKYSIIDDICNWTKWNKIEEYLIETA